MGNRLSQIEEYEVDPPDPAFDFFKDIRTDRIQYFYEELNANRLTEFSLEHPTDGLSWSDYFRLLVEIGEHGSRYNEAESRRAYHPAVQGLLLTPMEKEPLPEIPPKGVPDDFTEDEPSDEEDSDDDAGSDNNGGTGSKPGSMPSTPGRRPIARITPNWDPAVTNPIFFGVKTTPYQAYVDAREAKRALEMSEEKRIVEKTFAIRKEALTEFEKSHYGRESARQAKIDALIKSYTEANEKREKERERSERTLPAAGLNNYMRKWQKEKKAADKAYKVEVDAMRESHRLKTTEGEMELRLMKIDIDAFKEAESQVTPSADRLEEISREEMERGIAEVERTSDELEKVRLEYMDARLELQKEIDANNKDDALEMRSVVNLLETKIKVHRKAVNNAVERLSDAHVLLRRAVRIKMQQDKVLPLFMQILKGGYACIDPVKLPDIDAPDRPMSGDEHWEGTHHELPSECPLNFMMLALISLSKGTFEQKFKLFLHIYYRYEESGRGKPELDESNQTATAMAQPIILTMRRNDLKRMTFNMRFLQNMVINFHYMLHRTGFLPFPPYLEEVENSCYRHMLPFCLGNDRPETAHMTMFEFRSAIHQFCGLYYPIMRVLGLENDTGNKFSSYQRNVMSPLNLLSKGLMGAFTCRLKYHMDASRYRPLLDPSHKSDMHERAFAMGENDPLMPDYSVFMKKAGQRGVTNVVPLDHGHLHDLSYMVQQRKNEAACKIQSRARAVADRKYAAVEARMQAYLEAKEMALREMKDRILKEFKKRDDYKDAAKLKWDAQVRMRQAKLKSTGNKADRGETIMVMIEEAISRSSEDIDAKFRKIELEQNFPAGSLAPVDAATQAAIDKGLRVGKRKGAPSYNDIQGKEKVSRTGEKGDVGENIAVGKRIADVKGKFMTMFKKDDGIGGVEDIDEELTQGTSEPPAEANGEHIDGLAVKDIVVSISALSDETISAMVEGRYIKNPTGDGETLEEQDTARLLALSEPYDTSQLYARISAVDSAFSELRLKELLSELPSKRLLVQYIDNTGLMDLVDDLTSHFCLPRHVEKIACIFKNYVSSDFERGILKRSVKEQHILHENALRMFSYGEIHKRMLQLNASLKRKLIADPLLTDEEVLQSEDRRMSGIASRHQLALENTIAGINRMKIKFKKALINAQESERRKHTIKLLLEDNIKLQEKTRKKSVGISGAISADGDKEEKAEDPEVVALLELREKTARIAALAGMPPALATQSRQLMEGLVYLSEQTARGIGSTKRYEVEYSQRYNWVRRLSAAIFVRDKDTDDNDVDAALLGGILVKAGETAFEPVDGEESEGSQRQCSFPYYSIEEMKFLELKSICTAFSEHAQSDAAVIVSELYLLSYKKTIPVVKAEKVHGRGGKECGRGFEDGVVHVYEAHNIVYKVCLDYHGIFNGSDENAAKSGGHERLGAMYFSRFPVPRLHIPLISTIDIGGYRVLATAKLPNDVNVFNDDVELRKSAPDQVHGMVKNGTNFVNRSKALQSLLRKVATPLNCCEHYAKGTRDMGGSATVASAELNVYRVNEDEVAHFYCDNFWRTFPGEDPRVTWYLNRAPREQSVFWRQLRPELVRNYQVPLSPDATCAASLGTKDQLERSEEVASATKHLVDVLIPNTAERLLAFVNESNSAYPLSEGLGMDLTSLLHDNGVGMRHLGYLRHLFWRSLDGKGSVYFNESWLHTTSDLREDLFPGATIIIGDNQIFTIAPFEGKRQPTARKIPIVEKHKGLSIVKVSVRTGMSFNAELTSDKELQQQHDIRRTILAEMVARTIKSLVRFKLREYSRSYHAATSDIMKTTVCTYLNALTGAASNSVQLLNHEVFDYLRQKFGTIAVKSTERDHLHHAVRPCLIYIVKRIQAMLGLHMAAATIGDFYEGPSGFMFVTMDIMDVFPVVKHSISMLSYADAVLVDCAATRLEQSSYTHEVLKDEPVVYLRCSDRKGSRALDNKGTLGSKLRAIYVNEVELEDPGPLLGDPFNRSVRLISDRKTKVDTKYNTSVSLLDFSGHFAVELFLHTLPISKGQVVDLNMVAAQCGRWCISCNRDRMWIFTLQQGIHDVTIDLGTMRYNTWVHIACTFDGVYVRGYVDSILVNTVNAKDMMRDRIATYEEDVRQKKQELIDGEIKEKETLKSKTMAQAAEYFQSKAGIANIKALAAKILDSLEFKEERFGEAEAVDEAGAQKAKKAEAVSRAKKKYITELYIRTVRDVTEEYQTLNLELEEKLQKERENNQLFATRSLRLGAASPTGSATEGQKFYNGRISCVSIYQSALSADRIVVHFMAANADRSKEARRLFGIASSGYEKALLMTPNDPTILKKYASSLCGYLRVEIMKPPPAPSAEMITAGVVIASATANAGGVAKAKTKLMNVVTVFKERYMLDGIAQIMMKMPEEGEFSGLICHCFNSIMEVSTNYFATSDVIRRKDLVTIPRRFGLDILDNQPYFIATCAAIYKEVMRDPQLFDAYGDVKLGWLKDIKSPELVVAIVQQTGEDPSLLILKVGELFKTGVPGKFRDITIVDRDVEVLAEALPLLSVFDLSGCTRITSDAVGALSMSKYLRVVNLDRCTGLNDEGIAALAGLSEILEGISLVGLSQISDNGLLPVARACRALSYININNCSNISDITIETFAKNCRQLQTFHVSACLITEECFNDIAGLLPAKHLTSLDISFCREATDNSITAIVSRCSNLHYLNITGLTRVTEQTVRAACSNLWTLRHLHVEDVFLIDDRAFWFDIQYDSRQAAGENMLKELLSLNVADCSHLTDRAIEGLSTRCRKLEKLILKGCDKLTDKSLRFMIKMEDRFKFPMCDQLRHLDIGFCRKMTPKGLAELLPKCFTLEELVLTGVPFVNDEVVTNMCLACPTLLRLTFEKCALITDVSICAMSKQLWIERLNINYCPKITDAGIEVLALACTGLLSLSAKRNLKITDRSVISLLTHCKLLSHLDVDECTSLSLDIPTIARTVLDKRHVYITWPDHVFTTPPIVPTHQLQTQLQTVDTTGGDRSSAMADLTKMLMSESMPGGIKKNNPTARIMGATTGYSTPATAAGRAPPPSSATSPTNNALLRSSSAASIAKK